MSKKHDFSSKMTPKRVPKSMRKLKNFQFVRERVCSRRPRLYSDRLLKTTIGHSQEIPKFDQRAWKNTSKNQSKNEVPKSKKKHQKLRQKGKQNPPRIAPKINAKNDARKNFKNHR